MEYTVPTAYEMVTAYEAELEFDGNWVSLARLHACIKSCGYQVTANIMSHAQLDNMADTEE